MDPGSIRKWLA